jgi:hypothetical protein
MSIGMEQDAASSLGFDGLGVLDLKWLENCSIIKKIET